MSAPIVTAEHVSKWYGQVIGLNDVTVSVPPGITGLLGPNGAGKSTFMKLITGQLKPSKGSVKVLGEPIWRNPHLYFQIGFCPEQDAFYDRMTGLEWVTALVRLNGLDEKAADAAARRALTAVDLMDAKDKKIGAYSKGMRQRVKLAQAIVHDPDLLILDEPLAGMDPIARRKTIRLVRDWARAGKSIIVSSHILHEIESMTSNILLINNGRILAEGDVHHIRDLIDEHPHTVYVRAENPRGLARDFLDRADVRSMKFEEGAVIVETGKPDAFYARLTELAASGEYRRDRRGHVARRQPPGGVPVSGEMTMADPETPSPARPIPAAPGFLTSSLRVFDLSLGEMLWSRRTIFMLLVVGLPVLISLFVRSLVALGAPILEGSRMTGPAIFGMMIWIIYLRIAIPILGVFYGTSLMADEIEDKTITYLFTRPIRRGAVVVGKYLAYLGCTVFVVLPSVMLVYLLIVPIHGSLGGSFIDLLKDLSLLALGLAAYGALFAFIGAKFKRPLLIGLIFIFGWEQAALAFPGYLKKFTVAYYLQALVPHAMPDDNALSLIQGIFRENPPLWVSLFWIGAIWMTFLFLAAWVVERREYVLEQ